MTAPLRPFHELTPPPDGLAAVRRAARRRRTRSAVLTSVTGVLVVLGGVALLPHGEVRATDRLQVTDDPTVSPAPTATATGTPASPGPTGAPASAPAAVAATDGPGPTPTEVASPRGTSVPVPAYRTPDLRRAYVARPTPAGVTFCSGSASGSGSQLQSTVSWCLAASAPTTARGHDLVAQVCRDSSTDAQLTFASAREVELVVQDASGHEVWRWSTGHADPADAHALTVQREHCWTWTAPWTDVDGMGHALAGGSYRLVVRSRADELSTAPDAAATFSV